MFENLPEQSTEIFVSLRHRGRPSLIHPCPMVSLDFKMVQWFPPRCALQCLQGTMCTMANAVQILVTFSKVPNTSVGVENSDSLGKSPVFRCDIIPDCDQGQKGGKSAWKIFSPTLCVSLGTICFQIIWREKRIFAREIFSGRSYTIATRKVIMGHRLVFVPVPFTEQA